MNLFELFVKIGVDDQASGKLSDLSSKLGNGLKTAAKIGAAAVGAAAAGITALTTAAVNNYAEYEQLVGGVETLFKNSSNKVKKYADEAYKTAGLSANEYMETVTSFSASLLQSLEDDTEAAAEYADKAITDMADNANKMGTSIGMIQNAYQGFAKQNYTMLDNLKLGYGGTQKEMERLIKDANRVKKANGEMADLSIESFADVTEAIHIVQTEMGITGTTAQEAGSTVQGSIGSMKSAWENLVTSLANDDADLESAIDNLVKTIVGDGTEGNGGVIGNLLPKIETALGGIATVIEHLAPVISEAIPVLVETVLPSILTAAGEVLTAIIGVIFGEEAAEDMRGAAETLFTDIVPKLIEIFGELFEAIKPVAEIAFEIFNGIVNVLSDILSKDGAAEVIVGVATAIGAVTAATKLMNVAMSANPIGLLIGAIAGLIAYLATEEKAIKSVEEAQKALNDATRDYIDAETAFNDAIKRHEESIEALLAVEKEFGISGEELYSKVQDGALSYKEMSEQQRAVYDTYLNLIDAEKRVEETTLKASEAKRAETKAMLDHQLSLAAQSGEYESYKKSVMDAYEKGKISAEDAQEALSKAMTKMSLRSMETFRQDIPSDINAGLDPFKYASLLEQMERNFTNAFDDAAYAMEVLPSSAESIWQGIQLAFPDVEEWFKKTFEDAKNAVIGAWENIQEDFNKFWEDIKSAFDISSAVTWGKDMIDNFIKGIKDGWASLTKILNQTAQKVKNILGFSEPKEGPLSNFHTYAPDMMELFMQGIKQNQKRLQDTVSDAFNFGEQTISSGLSYKKYGANDSVLARAGGAVTTFSGLTIEINGANYSDENALAEAIAERLQSMTERRAAAYG